jgi:hypothetical protein
MTRNKTELVLTENTAGISFDDELLEVRNVLGAPEHWAKLEAKLV